MADFVWRWLLVPVLRALIGPLRRLEAWLPEDEDAGPGCSETGLHLVRDEQPEVRA